MTGTPNRSCERVPPGFSRRQLLRTATVVTIGGAAMTGATRAGGLGDQRWMFPTDERVVSSPTIVDGIVYVGCDDSHVYALDAATGDEEWRFETDDRVVSSPTVSEGTVFVGSWDDHLYALDAETGEKQWRFETRQKVTASPTVAAVPTNREDAGAESDRHLVFFGSDDTTVYALDTATGEEIWRFATSNLVRASPTVTDASFGDCPSGPSMRTTVFVGSELDGVYAIDARTGEQLWNTETGGQDRSSPTVYCGTVFVGSRDRNVYALDAETGDQQWRFETDGAIIASPTVADGIVFVGADIHGEQSDNGLYALDATTGKRQWRFQADRPVSSSPTIAGDKVFFADSSAVYSVAAETGEEVWRFDTGGRSSPTVVNGTVYVGSSEGVHAIESGVSGSSWGSRVQLRTLGHYGPEIDDPGRTDLSVRTDSADDSGPGFGVTLCGLGGAGYLLGTYLRSRKTQS